MYGYLKRLATAGAAYQAADVVAKLFALALLPVYTRVVPPAAYGVAETLLTLIILASIVLRLGVGEAFVRFSFLQEDEAARIRLARAATGFLLVATTLAAIPALAFGGPLSEVVLGQRDATLWALGVLGMWAFTNLELAYAILRVDERKAAYLAASLANVLLTIALTFTLVVGFDLEARGLLAGNYGASAVVLLGLWWTLRERVGLRPDLARLRPMLRFGLPTVPAEVSVFALNVVDRLYLLHEQGKPAAGYYAQSVKLAAVVVFVVRAFQYAWPPLAYSIDDDEQAARLYGLVTTWFALLTGLVVAGAALLGRWVVRIFLAPEFFPAHEALPWVALGWALYGLFLVLVAIAGRARVTTRNLPAALAGLGVNVALLVALVPAIGLAGAGIALCGAYVVMLAAMHALTRGLFRVPFEWGRLAHLLLVIGGVAVAGELLLPTDGLDGFVLRALAFLAIPALLLVTRFPRPEEAARLRALARGRFRLAPSG